MLRRLLLALVFLTAPAATGAAPPTLANLQPRGARPGAATTLTLTGAGLAPSTRLVLPFKAVQKALPDAKPNPASLRVELTVDASVAPGVYPVRAVNDDGVSALALFRVDALPSAAEVEDNNTFEKAQRLPSWPVVVEGQCPGGDVDFFRLRAARGQRLVVEVEAARLGSGVSPQVRVTDADRRLLASDDSESLGGDARVTLTAPADGDYVVEVSDARYRGGNPPFYRLRLGDYDVPEEVFPLGGRRGEVAAFTLRGGTLPRPVTFSRKLDSGPGRMSLPLEGVRRGTLPPLVVVGELPEQTALRSPGDRSAVELKPPLTVNGRLDAAGQVDRYRFAVTPGGRWRLAVEAEALGSRLDGVLTLLDDKGRQLAQADDSVIPSPVPGQPGLRSADPSLELTVPAGVTALLAELRDQRGRGGVNFGYRLTLEPVDDFALELLSGELNVPRGGAAALKVNVLRRGYTGPVELSIPDLPHGLSVQGGHVGDGGAGGVLTVSAGPDAAGGLHEVTVEGVAKAGRPARRTARRSLLLAPAAGAMGLWSLPKLAVAGTPAAPFRLCAPAEVTLVLGYPAKVPVKLGRAAGQEKLPVQVAAVLPGPPTAFVPAPPAAPSAAGEVTVELRSGPTLRPGRYDLAFAGTARVGPAQASSATPALTLTVRPPFEVQAPGRLTLRPGEAVKLTGKVVRHGEFKGPVRLALTGLPAGVTAGPVTPIKGDEFVVELKAAKPGASKAPLTLNFAAAAGGQNYAAPPVAVELEVMQ